MTFQFCLWDKFKDLATLSSSSFTNLVQMVTHLLTKNSLSLSILKVGDYPEFPGQLWCRVSEVKSKSTMSDGFFLKLHIYTCDFSFHPCLIFSLSHSPSLSRSLSGHRVWRTR